VLFPMAFIFSAIFSQTLGTPRNSVGLTVLSRSPIDPASASCLPRQTFYPHRRGTGASGHASVTLWGSPRSRLWQ
jgi:hypothetical protein